MCEPRVCPERCMFKQHRTAPDRHMCVVLVETLVQANNGYQRLVACTDDMPCEPSDLEALFCYD